MKTKTAKGITVFLILGAICASIVYCLFYPIKLNLVTLPEHIKEYYNRGRTIEESPTIEIYEGMGIGTYEYYLIEIGEQFGCVTLEKGLAGRYRITRLSFGNGNFLDGIIEYDGKKHLLFAGRDIAAQILKIKVLIDGQTYVLDNGSARGYFLSHIEIDNCVEDNHLDRAHISFYNEKGEDITALYDLSGGSIQQ